MVPRIGISTSSKSEVPGDASSTGTRNEIDEATDEVMHDYADMDEAGKRYSEETIDGIESSVSFLSSEGDGGKGTRWEERLKWWKVYALHFMFMWNSRTFEYVSIFLVASAFPESLIATSIKGITSTVSGLLFSSAVGNWVDRSPSRLRTLLITICINHAVVVVSYLCWLSWPVTADATAHSEGSFSSFQKGLLFGTILFLDIIHELSAIGNRLSLERDWVPELVGGMKPGTTYDLTQVNSVMVRIDLLCKLIAPSLLPVAISALHSRIAWVVTLAVLTALFWALEVWFAQIITRENSEIHIPKVPSNDSATAEDDAIEDRYNHLEPGLNSFPQKMCFILYQDPAARLRHYFSIAIWPASMAGSLLQLTVLAYSATLITYLLEIGFSLSSITIARASGSIMALSSTFVTPVVFRYMKKRQRRNGLRGDQGEVIQNEELEGRVIRTVGLWGISFQFLCLIPAVIVLWNLSPKLPGLVPTHRETTAFDASKNTPLHPIIPITLFASLSFSRVGHYMIHLMVEQLGQVEIPDSQRSTFAGTEQSFHSLFGLCHWAATAGLSRPEQFRYLALGSLWLVGVGVAVYVCWLRRPIQKEGVKYETIAMVDVLREDEVEGG